MKKPQSRPTFQATARIVVIASKNFQSENLSTAIVEAGQLKIKDFIELDSYEDASVLLTGVTDFNKHYDTEQ